MLFLIHNSVLLNVLFVTTILQWKREEERKSGKKIASFADALLGRHAIFPPQRTSADPSGKKRIDQSQQTSRSGKCTLDSEFFRMSIRAINMAIAGVAFQRVCVKLLFFFGIRV